MFKLPVCPRCGTVYRYKDVAGILKNRVFKREKAHRCYHCEKDFRVRLFPDILVPIALWLAVNIGVNIMLLNRIKELNLISFFIITIVLMALCAAVIPFFILFKREDKNVR